jgi:hypothetical protein
MNPDVRVAEIAEIFKVIQERPEVGPSMGKSLSYCRF